MSIYDEAVAYTRTRQQKFVDSLQDLLRIPSISTLPEHNPDMRRAAEWLAARLRALNFDRI